MRLLGRVGVTNSPAGYIESHNLGKDALELNMFEFIQLLKGKKRTLKSFLMDQEIIAGIGNEYSDEILFHSKLHPSRVTSELTTSETSMLYAAMLNILNEAISIESAGNEFPDRYLLKNRKVGKSCPICGTPIMSLRFSGRTAYFCPKCQKE
jgi:formamidopyrimidine-DNA glycosylase